MEEKFITQNQALIILALGFNMECWKGKTYLKLLPETKRNEFDEERWIMQEVTDGILSPKLRIDQAARWLREEMGIDIIVRPKFNSQTGDRIGYFWQWPQRTDVNMNPRTHKSYESALLNAISTILKPFEDYENYKNHKSSYR